MAKKLFLVDIDLNGNQLLNSKTQNLATAPSASPGISYYDTVSNSWKYYNGTTWVASLGGSVTNVTGSGAISVTNNSTTPAITIAAATTSVPGTMSAEDKIILDGLPASIALKAPLSSPLFTGYPKVKSAVAKAAGNGTDSVFSVVDSTGDTGETSTLFDVKTNGDCIIGGVITVKGTGTSTFAGDVSIGGKLTVSDTATATADLAGTDLTLTGNLIVKGNTTLGDAGSDTLIVQGIVALPSTTSIGSVTSTQLGYLSTLSSNVQTQLGAANLLTQIKTVDGTTSGLDADLLDAQEGTYYLARANHTGTQLHTTISDFDAGVVTNRLDQMAAPTSAVSMNGQRITSLAAPSTGTDAVNKDYVDAARAGLSIKDPVRVASTANVVIATGTLLAIDGVTTVAGDRVLLKNQTTASENGIYIAGTGAWTRSTDTDTSADVMAGTAIWVNEGTTNGDSRWVLTTNAAITLGTTSLVFTKDFQAADIVAGAGLTKSGTTLDVVGTANRITVAADSINIASTYVGQTSITTLGTITAGTWTGTDIAVADGGTGASTSAGAKTNLGFMTRYVADNLVATAGQVITYTHSLNTLDVIIRIYDKSTGATTEFDTCSTGVNTISVTANQALTAGTYRIVVIG